MRHVSAESAAGIITPAADVTLLPSFSMRGGVRDLQDPKLAVGVLSPSRRILRLHLAAGPRSQEQFLTEKTEGKKKRESVLWMSTEMENKSLNRYIFSSNDPGRPS